MLLASIIIEEFSARWRALKHENRQKPAKYSQKLRNFRLAEEHWNRNIVTHPSTKKWNWGIFGSLKSTETVLMDIFTLRVIRIEEFSARWRALKHCKRIILAIFEQNWGIFGSLKSTETSEPVLRLVRYPVNWGIFGSLKSTETVQQRA